MAQGEKVFEGALISRLSLLRPIKAYMDVGDEPTFEMLIYLARGVYQEQTGQDDFNEQYLAKYPRLPQ